MDKERLKKIESEAINLQLSVSDLIAEVTSLQILLEQREKSIIELYEALVIAYEPVTSIISAAQGKPYVLSHSVLDKYRDFYEVKNG